MPSIKWSTHWKFVRADCVDTTTPLNQAKREVAELRKRERTIRASSARGVCSPARIYRVKHRWVQVTAFKTTTPVFVCVVQSREKPATSAKAVIDAAKRVRQSLGFEPVAPTALAEVAR